MTATLPTSHTRERSLRIRSTIIRFSARSLSLSSSSTRAAAIDWWTPLDRRFTDSGRLVATGAVGVGYDPLRERWLVLLQRLDGRVAGLYALDGEGEVVGRWAVPRWPYRAIVDYGKFASSWTTTVAPRGHKIFLSAAGRLWTLELESGRLREGESGRFDRITTADWSADGNGSRSGIGRGA